MGLLLTLVGLGSAPAVAGVACRELGCGHHARFAHVLRGNLGAMATRGRDGIYPPPRVVDATHMTLEIVIEDMDTPEFSATQTLEVQAFDQPVASIPLDAKGLSITSVTVGGQPAAFEHDGMVLTITLDPPLAPGADTEIVTTYDVSDPPNGLFWTPASSAWPDRAAQIHTQGQPQTNSWWFPCHDYPNEMLTTEVVVTAPAGFMVSSNGRLESRERVVLPIDELTGERRLGAYERWHWIQDQPHVNYLVTLIVGKFDAVDVGTSAISMPVWVPPGRGPDVPGTYGMTAEMNAVFESLLREPYPWDRYAQLVVHNFAYGGMENTAATTMYDTAIIQPDALMDHDLEELISHELAHQWFGNLLTCDSWEHLWLNEGWATYMSGLWAERRSTPPSSQPWHPLGQAGYHQYVLEVFDSVIEEDRGTRPEAEGMASEVYTFPDDVFGRPANPYTKGASFLHILRMRVGDKAFFDATASFIDAHRHQNVNTDQFRAAMEQASGQDLAAFFEQWVRRPGIPRLEVATTWNQEAGTLEVTVAQTQTIDSDDPPFAFELPLSIGRAGTSPLATSVTIDQASHTFSVPLTGEPTFVAVDPQLTVLAEVTQRGPSSWLVAQAREGATLAARVRAVRSLVADDTLRVTEALRRLATDRRQMMPVRVEAIKVLAQRGSDRDVRSLFTTAADTWILREALARAVADVALSEANKDNTTMRAAIAEMLAERAASDASTRVRAACVRALGRLGALESLPLIIDAVNTPTQDDRLRQAALDAIADMAPPEGLILAMTYAAPGNNSRTRPVALRAVARLADQNPDQAMKTLVEALGDRELRTRHGAAEALATSGLPGAREALLAAADRTRDPEEAALFRGAADQASQPAVSLAPSTR